MTKAMDEGMKLLKAFYDVMNNSPFVQGNGPSSEEWFKGRSEREISLLSSVVTSLAAELLSGLPDEPRITWSFDLWDALVEYSSDVLDDVIDDDDDDSESDRLVGVTDHDLIVFGIREVFIRQMEAMERPVSHAKEHSFFQAILLLNGQALDSMGIGLFDGVRRMLLRESWATQQPTDEHADRMTDLRKQVAMWIDTDVTPVVCVQVWACMGWLPERIYAEFPTWVADANRFSSQAFGFDLFVFEEMISKWAFKPGDPPPPSNSEKPGSNSKQSNGNSEHPPET